jgi:formate dehydrogenase major subunit
MELTRRNFLKLAAGSAVGAGVLGFDITPAEAALPTLKISAAQVSKSVCVYCAVSCGLLVYSQPDGSANGRMRAIHVEGNPEDPVNRGALCPKGASLIDHINAPMRVTKPMYRKPGAADYAETTWDFALDRIARLIKDTRDRGFQARDDRGRRVNRVTNMATVIGGQAGTEEAYLGVKLARALGQVGVETPARI